MLFSTLFLLFLLIFNTTSLPSSIDLSNPAEVNSTTFQNYDESNYAPLGDVNNDGFMDLLVSSPDASTNGLTSNGVLYLFFDAQIHFNTTVNITSQTMTTFNSTESFSRAGSSICHIGDVNDDGLDDVLINTLNGSYIFFGRTNWNSNYDVPADADVSLNLAFVGQNCFSIGDINNDGISDIGLSDPQYSLYSGAFFVVYGSTSLTSGSLDALDGSNGTLFHGERSLTNFEFPGSVSAGGDFNGDSLPDIAIGIASDDTTDTDSGLVYVILGQGSNYQSIYNCTADANLTLFGAVASQGFGSQVDLTGDVSSDSFDDLLVSTTGGTTPGIYLWYGTNSISTPQTALADTGSGSTYTKLFSLDSEFLGKTLSRVSDINGDSIGDILATWDSNAILIFGNSSFPATVNVSSDAGFGDKIDFTGGSALKPSPYSTTFDLNCDGGSDLFFHDASVLNGESVTIFNEYPQTSLIHPACLTINSFSPQYTFDFNSDSLTTLTLDSGQMMPSTTPICRYVAAHDISLVSSGNLTFDWDGTTLTCNGTDPAPLRTGLTIDQPLNLYIQFSFDGKKWSSFPSLGYTSDPGNTPSIIIAAYSFDSIDIAISSTSNLPATLNITGSQFFNVSVINHNITALYSLTTDFLTNETVDCAYTSSTLISCDAPSLSASPAPLPLFVQIQFGENTETSYIPSISVEPSRYQLSTASNFFVIVNPQVTNLDISVLQIESSDSIPVGITGTGFFNNTQESTVDILVYDGTTTVEQIHCRWINGTFDSIFASTHQIVAVTNVTILGDSSFSCNYPSTAFTTFGLEEFFTLSVTVDGGFYYSPVINSTDILPETQVFLSNSTFTTYTQTNSLYQGVSVVFNGSFTDSLEHKCYSCNGSVEFSTTATSFGDLVAESTCLVTIASVTPTQLTCSSIDVYADSNRTRFFFSTNSLLQVVGISPDVPLSSISSGNIDDFSLNLITGTPSITSFSLNNTFIQSLGVEIFIYGSEFYDLSGLGFYFNSSDSDISSVFTPYSISYVDSTTLRVILDDFSIDGQFNVSATTNGGQTWTLPSTSPDFYAYNISLTDISPQQWLYSESKELVVSGSGFFTPDNQYECYLSSPVNQYIVAIYDSPTQLNCSTSSIGSPATVNISVTLNRLNFTNELEFAFQDPQITDISAYILPIEYNSSTYGYYQVNVSGTDFVDTPTLFCQWNASTISVSSTASFYDSTTIGCDVPDLSVADQATLGNFQIGNLSIISSLTHPSTSIDFTWAVFNITLLDRSQVLTNINTNITLDTTYVEDNGTLICRFYTGDKLSYVDATVVSVPDSSTLVCQVPPLTNGFYSASSLVSYSLDGIYFGNSFPISFGNISLSTIDIFHIEFNSTSPVTITVNGTGFESFLSMYCQFNYQSNSFIYTSAASRLSSTQVSCDIFDYTNISLPETVFTSITLEPSSNLTAPVTYPTITSDPLLEIYISDSGQKVVVPDVVNINSSASFQISISIPPTATLGSTIVNLLDATNTTVASAIVNQFIGGTAIECTLPDLLQGGEFNVSVSFSSGSTFTTFYDVLYVNELQVQSIDREYTSPYGSVVNISLSSPNNLELFSLLSIDCIFLNSTDGSYNWTTTASVVGDTFITCPTPVFASNPSLPQTIISDIFTVNVSVQYANAIDQIPLSGQFGFIFPELDTSTNLTIPPIEYVLSGHSIEIIGSGFLSTSTCVIRLENHFDSFNVSFVSASDITLTNLYCVLPDLSFMNYNNDSFINVRVYISDNTSDSSLMSTHFHNLTIAKEKLTSVSISPKSVLSDSFTSAQYVNISTYDILFDSEIVCQFNFTDQATFDMYECPPTYVGMNLVQCPIPFSLFAANGTVDQLVDQVVQLTAKLNNQSDGFASVATDVEFKFLRPSISGSILPPVQHVVDGSLIPIEFTVTGIDSRYIGQIYCVYNVSTENSFDNTVIQPSIGNSSTGFSIDTVVCDSFISLSSPGFINVSIVLTLQALGNSSFQVFYQDPAVDTFSTRLLFENVSYSSLNYDFYGSFFHYPANQQTLCLFVLSGYNDSNGYNWQSDPLLAPVNVTVSAQVFSSSWIQCTDANLTEIGIYTLSISENNGSTWVHFPETISTIIDSPVKVEIPSFQYSPLFNGQNFATSTDNIAMVDTTFMIWIHPKTFDGGIILADSYSLQIDSSGYIIFHEFANSFVYTSDQPLILNSPSSLVFTITNSKFSFYINGHLDGVVSVSSLNCSTSSTVFYGAHVNSSSFYGFNGFIGNVRIFDSILSAIEMQECLSSYNCSVTPLFSLNSKISDFASSDEQWTSLWSVGSAILWNAHFSLSSFGYSNGDSYLETFNLEFAPSNPNISYSFLAFSFIDRALLSNGSLIDAPNVTVSKTLNFSNITGSFIENTTIFQFSGFDNETLIVDSILDSSMSSSSSSSQVSIPCVITDINSNLISVSETKSLALRFNSNRQQYLTLSSPEILSASSQITWEMWLQVHTQQTYDSPETRFQVLVSSGSPVDQGGLRIAFDRQYDALRVSLWCSTKLCIGEAFFPISLDSWTHLAVTYASNTLQVFINGSNVFSGFAPTLSSTSSPIYIGRNDPNRTSESLESLPHFADFSLDEFRVWKRVLSLNEIAYQFNKSFSALSDPDLIAYLDFSNASDPFSYPPISHTFVVTSFSNGLTDDFILEQSSIDIAKVYHFDEDSLSSIWSNANMSSSTYHVQFNIFDGTMMYYGNSSIPAIPEISILPEFGSFRNSTSPLSLGRIDPSEPFNYLSDVNFAGIDDKASIIFFQPQSAYANYLDPPSAFYEPSQTQFYFIIGPTNDPPSINYTGPLTFAVSTFATIPEIIISDDSASDFSEILVSMSVTNGTLNVRNGTATTVTYLEGTSSVGQYIVFSGNLAAINDALFWTRYDRDTSFKGIDTFILNVYDNGSNIQPTTNLSSSLNIDFNVAASTAGNNSIITGYSSPVVVGTATQITLNAIDENFAHLTNGQDAALFSISSVPPCGSGCPLNPTYNVLSEYIFTITVEKAGLYNFTMLVGTEEMIGSPFQINFTHGPVDAVNSIAFGSGLYSGNQTIVSGGSNHPVFGKTNSQDSAVASDNQDDHNANSLILMNSDNSLIRSQLQPKAPCNSTDLRLCINTITFFVQLLDSFSNPVISGSDGEFIHITLEDIDPSLFGPSISYMTNGTYQIDLVVRASASTTMTIYFGNDPGSNHISQDDFDVYAVCPLGQAKTDDFTCVKCEENTWVQYTGSSYSQCVSCPPNTQSLPESELITDCVCSPNYYKPNTTECESCLTLYGEGAVCRGGDLIPIPAPGYWRDQVDGKYFFYICNPQSSCEGGVNNTCAKGYSGPRCGSCSTGYFKLSDRCSICTGGSETSLFGLAIFIMAPGVMVGLFLRLASKVKYVAPTIALNYIQVLALLARFKIQWPFSITFILDASQWSLFTNIQISSPECFFANGAYSTRFLLGMVSPIIYLAWFLLFFALGRIHLWFVRRFGPHFIRYHPQWCIVPDSDDPLMFKLKLSLTKLLVTAKTKNALANLIIQGLVLFFSFAHLMLTIQSLEVFDCTKQHNGNYTLDAYPVLLCDESEEEWAQLVLPAALFFCLYGIGIPLILILTLYYHRDELHLPKNYERFAFLYIRYKYNYYWWEVVAIMVLRKAALAVTMLFFTYRLDLASIFSLCILFLSLLLNNAHPYCRKLNNKIDIALLAVSFLVLLAGMLFFTSLFSGDIQNIVENSLIVLLLASIAFCIIIIGYEVYVKIHGNSEFQLWKMNAIDYLEQKAKMKDFKSITTDDSFDVSLTDLSVNSLIRKNEDPTQPDLHASFIQAHSPRNIVSPLDVNFVVPKPSDSQIQLQREAISQHLAAPAPTGENQLPNRNSLSALVSHYSMKNMKNMPSNLSGQHRASMFRPRAETYLLPEILDATQEDLSSETTANNVLDIRLRDINLTWYSMEMFVDDQQVWHIITNDITYDPREEHLLYRINQSDLVKRNLLSKCWNWIFSFRKTHSNTVQVTESDETIDLGDFSITNVDDGEEDENIENSSNPSVSSNASTLSNGRSNSLNHNNSLSLPPPISTSFIENMNSGIQNQVTGNDSQQVNDEDIDLSFNLTDMVAAANQQVKPIDPAVNLLAFGRNFGTIAPTPPPRNNRPKMPPPPPSSSDEDSHTDESDSEFIELY